MAAPVRWSLSSVAFAVRERCLASAREMASCNGHISTMTAMPPNTEGPNERQRSTTAKKICNGDDQTMLIVPHAALSRPQSEDTRLDSFPPSAPSRRR